MTALPEPTRFGHLDFNSPIAPRRAERLVANPAAARPSTVVDIGCGWGELLLRLAAALPEAAATGIDAEPLERAREAAKRRGLEGRVAFTEPPGREWDEPADLVVCIGASHAFGDSAAALAGLHRLVEPGGRLVFGEEFWEQVPTEAQLAHMWPGTAVTDMLEPADLVDAAVATGLRPLRVEAVEQSEWDDFESGFLADKETWLLANAGAPGCEEVRERADAHRGRWLRGHRRLVGFAYPTLGRPL